MQRLGAQSRFAQFVSHDFCGVLRGDKHQYPVPVRACHQMAQQARAFFAIHRKGALRDVGLGCKGLAQVHAHRLLQQSHGPTTDCRRKGGRQK